MTKIIQKSTTSFFNFLYKTGSKYMTHLPQKMNYGIDERAPIERYTLRSCEPADVTFIELIENY